VWLSTEMGSLPNWTVQAHGEGATADEILNYLSSEFRMTVRPNTLVPRHLSLPELVKGTILAPNRGNRFKRVEEILQNTRSPRYYTLIIQRASVLSRLARN